MDATARGHHHATTDSVKRVGSKTSTDSNTPTEQEGGEEGTLERTDKNDRLCDVAVSAYTESEAILERTKRIVDTEVETTVNDDANNRGDKSTVETSNTIRREGLLVDID